MTHGRFRGRPHLGTLRAFVDELTVLPEDHPAESSSCVSVLAPCFLMLLVDRPTLRRAFPKLGLTPTPWFVAWPGSRRPAWPLSPPRRVRRRRPSRFLLAWGRQPPVPAGYDALVRPCRLQGCGYYQRVR
jgi:hypothetical protein